MPHRFPAVVFALGATCLLAPGRVEGAGPEAPVPDVAEHGRWPIWPTEIDELAAPLRDPAPKASQERDREQALRALEAFATPLIAADVVSAIEDPATQVRREALRICYERRIRACTPGAVTTWSGSLDPVLRTAALKVLAVDHDPAHVVILIAALRESNDQIRADAAQLLGWAALSSAGRKDARRALVAKLNDISAFVRQRAVVSLGLLGAKDATLAIARLLEDPEPAVRAAAAGALALGRDARAAPALIRAIDGMNEPMVTKSIIDALAQLPGKQVADELLARLDDPPTGLTSRHIADAIGNRPHPEAHLIDGLIARLREPSLRSAAIGTLLVIGDHATDALREAERRGLSPAVAVEVRRLLDAMASFEGPEDVQPRFPDEGDHAGWLDRMRRGPERSRMLAARKLAAFAPAWLARAITAELRTPGALEGRRPWVIAIVLATRPLDLDLIAWTTLEGWARDKRLAASDRCVAAAALGAASPRKHRKRAKDALVALIEDPDPTVRACTAHPLARLDITGVEALLLDPAPSVRTNALLALATAEPAKTVGTRLAWMHIHDPNAAVRAAAGLALDASPLDPRLDLVFVDEPDKPWSLLPRWLPMEVKGQRAWIPLIGRGRHRWALAPRQAQRLPRTPFSSHPGSGDS